jgi:ribonuclease HI/probable phosphoglycerate mutase
VEVLERALALARAKRVEPVQLAFADPMVAKGTTGLRQPNAGDTVIGEQESQRGQNAQGTRKPSDRQAPKRWPESVVAFTDGACRGNPGPSSVGVVFLADGGEALGEVSETVGTGTNNEAEYKAVIRALEVARSHGVSQLLIRADSELMVRQMQGVYQVKAESIRPLFNRAKMLLREFRSVRFEHVRREANREADRLANEALDRSN